MRLLQAQIHFLILGLLDFNLKFRLHFIRVFEGSNLHKAGITKNVEPFQLHLAKDFILELINFVIDRILRLQYENERSYFLRTKCDGLFLQVVIDIYQLVGLRVPNQKLNMVWEHFIDAGIRNLNLKNVSVIPQDDVL